MYTSTHQAVSAKAAQFLRVDSNPERQPNAMNAVAFVAQAPEASPRMPLFEARRRRSARRANR